MTDLALLSQLSESELRALNTTIVALIKSKVGARVKTATRQFCVGQSVKWDSKRGYPIQGVITKIKVKMIEVDAGSNGKWNVGATLLKAA